MKKTIKIGHPDAENVLDLKQLTEVCFRVSEHLNELWAKYDKLPQNENLSYDLGIRFTHAAKEVEKAAWRIKNLQEWYGDLPF